MDTLYTFWDNNTHYKPKSVHFRGLMNSATKPKPLEEALKELEAPKCGDFGVFGLPDVQLMWTCRRDFHIPKVQT